MKVRPRIAQEEVWGYPGKKVIGKRQQVNQRASATAAWSGALSLSGGRQPERVTKYPWEYSRVGRPRKTIYGNLQL